MDITPEERAFMDAKDQEVLTLTRLMLRYTRSEEKDPGLWEEIASRKKALLGQEKGF